MSLFSSLSAAHFFIVSLETSGRSGVFSSSWRGGASFRFCIHSDSVFWFFSNFALESLSAFNRIQRLERFATNSFKRYFALLQGSKLATTSCIDGLSSGFLDSTCSAVMNSLHLALIQPG